MQKHWPSKHDYKSIKMIAIKKRQRVNLIPIIKKKAKSVLLTAVLYALGLAIASLFAGFAFVFVLIIFILIFPFVYVGLLLQQSYKDYRLNKILTRSFDTLINQGFEIEHGSAIKLIGAIGDQVVAVSLERSDLKHYLFFEALLLAGEGRNVTFSSPNPLIFRNAGEGVGMWVGQQRKVKIQNGLIKNANDSFLQAFEDFKGYGLLK